MGFGTIGEVFAWLGDDKGALFAEGAAEGALDACSAALAAMGLPPLPEDYRAFLRLSDGFAWNGFEFFGVSGITEERTGFYFEDIVSYNGRKRAGNRKNVLYVGVVDGDVCCCDPSLGRYACLDRDGLPAEEYGSFEELFTAKMTDCVEYGDLFAEDDAYA